MQRMSLRRVCGEDGGGKMRAAAAGTGLVMIVVRTMMMVVMVMKMIMNNWYIKILPKALRTQALTASTSNFGWVGLVQYAWQNWFGRFGLVW